MGIKVTAEEYSGVQKAIANILADYGVTNQSDGKLRYLAAKALLHSNHQSLQDLLSLESESLNHPDKPSLTLIQFRELAGQQLSRYQLDDVYVCDNCELTLPSELHASVTRPSLRISGDGLWTDYECSDCGSLAYNLKDMIAGSAIDKLFHDKTLTMSHDHADAFGRHIIKEESFDDNYEYDRLLSKLRLFYIDLLSNVTTQKELKSTNTTISTAVNAFIELGSVDKKKSLRNIREKTISSIPPAFKADLDKYLDDATSVFFFLRK